MKDYREYPPQKSETNRDYARRLESGGAEEMWIRKALRHHRQMPLKDMGNFFEDFSEARLKHLQLLKNNQPHRTYHSFVKKVSKNLGVSKERAEFWIKKLEETQLDKTDFLSGKNND